MHTLYAVCVYRVCTYINIYTMYVCIYRWIYIYIYIYITFYGRVIAVVSQQYARACMYVYIYLPIYIYIYEHLQGRAMVVVSSAYAVRADRHLR